MLRPTTVLLRITLSRSCLLLAVCWFVPHLAFAQSAGDEAGVRMLVERFFDLYQKRDLDGLMGLWSEKSPDFATSRQRLQQIFAANKIQLKSVTIDKLMVGTESATVNALAEVFAEDVKTGKAAEGFGIMNRTFHLLKEGEAWKVWQCEVPEQGFAAAFVAAKTEDERKALLEAHKELVTDELVRALLSEGSRLQTRSEYSSALSTYQSALDLARQLHYQIGAATAARRIGLVHDSQGNYTQALEHYQWSLKIAEEIGDKPLIVRALNNMGNAYRGQGNNAQAMEHYQKTLQISEEIGDNEVIAGVLNNIGSIHESEANYTQALAQYQRSLKISEELGDKQMVAKILGNIGNAHDWLGNYAEALEHLHRSLQIKEEIGDKRGIANALNNIGSVHISRGNYAQAMEHLQRSLQIKKEIGNKGLLAITLNNIGVVYYLQGNYAQAMEQYQKVLKISEETGDTELFANSLNGIGNVHRSRGDYAQAMEYYQRALKISEGIGIKRGVASALLKIGDVQYEQGDYSHAMEQYQRVLKVSEETGDRLTIAGMLRNIGLVHYRQGNYAQAMEHLQRSVTIGREVNEKRGVAIALTTIGSISREQGKSSLARKALTNAIDTIEEMRGEVVGNEQQKQQFFQTMLSPYYQMIQLLLDEKNPDEAFGYAERVKARALLDTLENGRVQVTKAMTESEKSEEQRLNAQVVSLNTQVSREKLRKEPDKAVLSDLETRRDRARADYEAFQIDLYAAHPELKVQRGRMNPVGLNEVSDLLPDNTTAIAEYVVTEDNTYLFILTRKRQPQVDRGSSADPATLYVYPLKVKQKDLATLVERFRGRLTQKDNEFSGFARQLYDLLIGPARSYLKDQTSLIIVPDGVLWEVPFQALQSPGNRFLIQDYAISYAPSLTVLREMMNLKRKHQAAQAGLPALIAFGNPDVTPTTAANLRAVYPEVLADERLLPLPQTEDMLKILSRIYGPDRSKVYVRTEAREDRAKKEAGDCRVLQFATHGILDNINPMYSRLVMSQSGVGEHEDGMLEAWEIMRLDLKAEMVVLAACETARGRVAGGEAMIGLAWAFFVAGCPTTVVSQWRVEVNSMSRLMIDFHKRLKPGLAARGGNVSKAEALRAASLKLMRNPRYRHPFYWAPFVLMGNDR